MKIPRHLLPTLIEDARVFPVITVTGPRQSGKTTLVRAAFPDHTYVSLEDPDERGHALDDPRGFIGRTQGGLIIDEAHHAPELFSYLQGIVDGEDRPGRFILTGSHNFLLMQAVSQTLAGRAAIHHLLPLSHDELLGRPGLATGGLSSAERTSKPPNDLFKTLFTGGYPRIHDKKLSPHRWLRGYHQAYLERDVRQVLNVGDIDAFRRFVLLCAGRAGQILNLSSLANDCGIAQPTARRWLSVLEASFIVRLLRPYYRNFGKRMIKAPKLYFVDSGLLCYLLRIRSAEELRFHASRGAVFESWVVSEFTKRAWNAGAEPDLWFWRDRRGHEIDLIVEAEGSAWMIELKSGQTLGSDAFKNIDFLRALPDGGAMKAAVIFGGDRNEQRTKGLVRAWWSL